MNIIELCKYRETCAICGKQMKLSMHDNLFTFAANIADACLTIRGATLARNLSKEIQFVFKPDGTYTHNKQANLRFFTVYVNCIECTTGQFSKNDNIIFHLKDSSIKTLNKKLCAYSIELSLNKDGSFVSEISYETIKFHDNDFFYHINVDRHNEKSYIYSGRLNGKSTDIFSLDVDHVINMRNLHSIEMVKKKIGIYNLFS